jgi:chromosome segregation ATPase
MKSKNNDVENNNEFQNEISDFRSGIRKLIDETQKNKIQELNTKFSKQFEKLRSDFENQINGIVDKRVDNFRNEMSKKFEKVLKSNFDETNNKILSMGEFFKKETNQLKKEKSEGINKELYNQINLLKDYADQNKKEIENLKSFSGKGINEKINELRDAIIENKRSIENLMRGGKIKGSIKFDDSAVNDLKRTVEENKRSLEILKSQIENISTTKTKKFTIPDTISDKKATELEQKIINIENRINSLKPIRLPENIKDITPPQTASKESRDDIKKIDFKFQEISKRIDTLENSKTDSDKIRNEIRNLIENEMKRLKLTDVRARAEEFRKREDELKKLISQGNTIKMLADKSGVKQFDEKINSLSDKIKTVLENFDKKINNMEDNLKNLMAASENSKKSMESVKKDIEMIRKGPVEANMKELEKDIYREFERVNSNIKNILEKSREDAEKIEIEMKTIKNQFEGLKKVENELKKMDTSNIIKDIEAVKSKQEFMEKNMEKMSTEPIHDRMEEIEAAIKRMKITSPIIIE